MLFTANEKIFGREKPIKDILGKLGDGESIALVGEEGSGKSMILVTVLKILSNKPIGRVVCLSSIRTEKSAWQGVASQLCTDIDESKIYSNNTNTDQLSAWVCSEFRNSPDRIFILVDNVNSSLPSKTVEALCTLLSLGGIMLIATRSLNINKALVEKLQPVEIASLSKNDAFQMIEELVAEKSVNDMSFLKKHLYQKSRGLPGLIKKAIDGFKGERITRKTVESISIQVSEKTRFMLVPISAVLIAFLAINRYVGRVTTFEGGRVDYVLSATGLVVALIFRFAVYPYMRKEK